jgi:ATP-binding cassette subfamily F protein 3
MGHSVEPAYFSQHEIELDETRTVLAVTQIETGLRRPEAQNLLGRFLFTGWEMHERSVSALSGGERRRLALALVVASGANLLLLDEPTNHLDLESREALEVALEAFPGTVLLVSHDRALLDAVAHRTLAIEDGTIRSYEGGWAEYVARRDELAAAAEAPVAKPAKKAKRQPAKPRRARPSELEEIEQEIQAREAEIAELERKLADDWSDVDVVAAHRRTRDELQTLLSRWEQLFERSQA